MTIAAPVSPANLNAPEAVVQVYQNPDGTWSVNGSSAVIAGTVSIANLNSPVAVATLSYDGTNWLVADL